MLILLLLILVILVPTIIATYLILNKQSKSEVSQELLDSITPKADNSDLDSMVEHHKIDMNYEVKH